MKNALQRYAWGSPTLLPELLGIPNDSGEPIAEVWMGAHPKAPSGLIIEDATLPLNHAVEEDPVGWLGPAVSQRYNGEFPFLLKLLSAEISLSIQVHPNKRQAEEGFKREVEAGIAGDAPNRNYRDKNHKPEMMVALTDFFALCGFRSGVEIEANLTPYIHHVGGEAARLPRPTEAGLREWFGGWMHLSGEAKRSLIDAVLQESEQGEDGVESPLWWVSELNRQHPGDFGVLSPLFLNLLRMSPGDALYLGSGLLHAYLKGAGVEIMANSDNVLRSGCTTKHVDPEELLRILDFSTIACKEIVPFPVAEGISLYRTPAEEFELLRLDLDEHTREIRRNVTNRPPLILLSVAGKVEVTAEGLSAEGMGPGDSLYVTPGTATVEVRGPGVVYCATIAGGLGD